MGRVDWEVGVDKIYITLYIEWMAIEWMANEGLLYSSGRSTPCSIVNLNRKEMKVNQPYTHIQPPLFFHFLPI